MREVNEKLLADCNSSLDENNRDNSKSESELCINSRNSKNDLV
jgi:hypothetical protein